MQRRTFVTVVLGVLGLRKIPVKSQPKETSRIENIFVAFPTIKRHEWQAKIEEIQRDKFLSSKLGIPWNVDHS